MGAWINISNHSTYRSIMNRMEFPTARGWYLSVESTGGFAVILRNANGNRIFTRTGNNTIPTNTWVYLSLTYNGSSNASGVNMFINGVLVSKETIENTLTMTTITSADTPCAIGQRVIANDAKWLGLMNDNFIYENKVLTPEEVNINFQATKHKYGL